MTSWPLAFVVKLPARVYWRRPVGFAAWAASGARTKKPSPWMPTSIALPVDWNVPVVIRLSIDDSCTPRPTWAGLAPPCVALGAAPPRWSWASESLNVVRADLYPTVLTLAMSFAVTSSIVWWFFRPLIAANMLRIMGASTPC